jgi:hypothetical protein
MTKEEVDNRVEQAIRQGAQFLRNIQIQTGFEMRAVDHSLQRLRKAGRAKYQAKDGWALGGTGGTAEGGA